MAKWAEMKYHQCCGGMGNHIPSCKMASPTYINPDNFLCPACNYIGKHSEDCVIGMLTGDDAPATAGRKDDSGKARHDLIPPELPEAVAQVLAFGATKYGERNWEKGMTWGRPFAAMMRHLWAWWRGEKADPETGFSHLWHAAACIAFLIAFEQRAKGKDDRP